MVRAPIEGGLRSVVNDAVRSESFKLRRASVGGKGRQAEFSDASWEQLRDAIYEGRGPQ